MAYKNPSRNVKNGYAPSGRPSRADARFASQSAPDYRKSSTKKARNKYSDANSLQEKLIKDEHPKYAILFNSEPKILTIDGKEIKVYRIKAKLDLVVNGEIVVKRGDIGGYVQSYDNLSSRGTCWIYDDAVVCQDAVVKEHARATDNSKLFGSARLSGFAQAKDNAVLTDSSSARDYAVASNNSNIGGRSRLTNRAKVGGEAILVDTLVEKEAIVDGSTQAYRSVITDTCDVYGQSRLEYVFAQHSSKICSSTLKGSADKNGANIIHVSDGAFIARSNIEKGVKISGEVTLKRCTIEAYTTIRGKDEINNKTITPRTLQIFQKREKESEDIVKMRELSNAIALPKGDRKDEDDAEYRDFLR